MNFTKIYNEKLNETLFHGVHKSGLNIFLLPKLGFSKKYAIYSVKYGSTDISYKLNQKNITDPKGIAHFLEHKLFELPGGGNAFDLFSKTGASANAFTSHNMTGYLFSCSDNFNDNLDILLSYVGDPYFTDENVEKEQGIIAQEIKMYDDDPEWKLFNNALNALYHANSVKDDIAGSVSSIAQINKEVLYNSYNSFYHPENMILFVAGDVSLDDIERIADKNVKTKENPFSVERMEYEETQTVNQNRITKKMSVSQNNFILGFKDSDIGYDGKKLLKKNIESNLILKMLFSESAPLYNYLYNNNLINDSFSSDTLGSNSYFATLIGGETKNVDTTIDAILQKLAEIKKTGLSEADFITTKKASFGRQIKAFNSLETIANGFSSNFFSNIGSFDFIDIYDEININSINERLVRMFNDNYAISEVEPG
jgi:predicted Zn-dependent peptidase